MPDERVTHHVCPLCNGNKMIVKETIRGYKGVECWLCQGVGMIHPNIYGRWVAAGRPSVEPDDSM